MLGDSDKPLILYGEGGCGKTSLLAKSAGLTSTVWLTGRKPISVIRYLGTTPDSSALTPTLISICQQVNILHIALHSSLSLSLSLQKIKLKRLFSDFLQLWTII